MVVESLLPRGVDLADAEGYVGDGPTPEVVESTALATLDRFDRFFRSMPSNLSLVALKDKEGVSWFVDCRSTINPESAEELIEGITLDNRIRERVVMHLRRPDHDSRINYPFDVIDYKLGENEQNTHWAIERVTSLTDELLGPFEATLPQLTPDENPVA